MSEEDRRALRELKVELRAVREKMGDVGSKGRGVVIATHMVWFLLPFVCLWSLGVEPATAARVAVAPCCIMMMIGMVAWTLMTSSADDIVKRTTTALEILERAERQ